MVQTKRENYAEYADELSRAGIEYAPIVWSCYGRPHPDAARTLVTLARCTARRWGGGNYRAQARRTAARITTELWRRAAQMVLACWPPPAEAAEVPPWGGEV